MDRKNEKINKIILRISKGELIALEELFEDVGGLMLGMAKKYLIDKSLAEDLVSEIFCRLVKNAKSFDVNKNGLNWLYKSIHNEAINWNKKYNPNNIVGIEIYTNLADVILPIDDNKIMLKEAMKTLSKIENEILYYKFWEGLAIRDISKRIKVPRSTIQDLYNKALKKIAKIIDDSDK